MFLLNLVAAVALLCLVYAWYNYNTLLKLSKGNSDMARIATAIQDGAHAFLHREHQVIFKTVIVLFVVLATFIQLSCALAFLVGVFIVGITSFIGLCASTEANVRVTNIALVSKHIAKTLRTALCGGSIMGVSVHSFTLIGICSTFALIVLSLKHHDFGNFSILSMFYTSTNIFSFNPFSMTLTSCALGCSVMALFNRVGGGIFTKANDMGADLVGKNEQDIPEDDARNPATIADNVGDIVGDTIGLNADLMESNMASLVSCIVVIDFIFNKYQALGLQFSESLYHKLCLYPILFSTIGLISSVIALYYVISSKSNTNNPRTELNKLTIISAGITIIGTFIMTIWLFRSDNTGDLPFAFGIYSPYIAAVIGIVAGICIGQITEYYTSYDYQPTKQVSSSAEEGPAILLTQGLSVGMKSVLLAIFVLGLAILISNATAEKYGIAIAAVGMLSFISVMVSVDTYGPISDNAGGIAEMAKLGNDVREITDCLDSVGNTTAAIGKGFSIGSAALTTISLLVSFMYSTAPITEDVIIDMMNPLVLVGTMVGAAISYYFSGMLIESVAVCAKKVVIEVRRQFKNIPGLKEGKAFPDYISCVDMSTKGALDKMRMPAVISITVAVASGFIFGAQFVQGILIGSIITASMLAIFSGNTGGLLDNAKKYIEATGEKGSDEHKAAVIGDTVGDPLKDTSGPSLNILIKIMCTASIIMAPIYNTYNLPKLIEFVTQNYQEYVANVLYNYCVVLGNFTIL